MIDSKNLILKVNSELCDTSRRLCQKEAHQFEEIILKEFKKRGHEI